MNQTKVALIFLILMKGLVAQAGWNPEQKLKQFSNSPREFMSRIPEKFSDQKLLNKAELDLRFSSDQKSTGAFVSVKSAEWDACHRNNKAATIYASTEEPWASFFEDEGIVYNLATNLSQMESRQLLSAELSEHPWSGDFWPIAKGVLGARYLEPNFNDIYGWQKRFQFVQNHSADSVLAAKGQDGVDELSAAEKYDLLVGDERLAFTDSQWQQGKQYYDRDGKVEEWMGICHGWAPASFMEPRPEKAVTVKSYDHKWDVKFYPGEIKGLLSYSWAENSYRTKYLGRRCNKKDPKTDENGRLLDPECFDLNPSTWHKLVVNHIGVLKKSFVIDATFDYEVWNQPVFAYSYTYFNPKTKKTTSDLSKAQVSRQDFDKDVFAKYRSPQAQSFVGIAMRIGYTVEVRTNSNEEDSPAHDQVRWVEYLYDLELDADGNIIGGEWYQKAHPDFAWAPMRNSKPQSPRDSEVINVGWTADSIPSEWSEAAKESSPDGTILNTIAEGLLKRTFLRR